MPIIGLLLVSLFHPPLQRREVQEGQLASRASRCALIHTGMKCGAEVAKGAAVGCQLPGSVAVAGCCWLSLPLSLQVSNHTGRRIVATAKELRRDRRRCVAGKRNLQLQRARHGKLTTRQPPMQAKPR